MMATADERAPTLEERYITATNASDLTVDPNHRRPVDLIIASGLTNDQLGAALKNLRSEWDTCSRPRKHTDAEILARAAEIPNKKGKPDVARARTECLLAFSRGMRERAMRLRGRAVVMEQLTAWALMKGIDPDVVSPTLFHWLAPTCPVCDGRMFMKMPDAPVLSNKTCRHCSGAGTWPEPPGGEKVRAHIDYCLNRHQGGMAIRTRG